MKLVDVVPDAGDTVPLQTWVLLPGHVGPAAAVGRAVRPTVAVMASASAVSPAMNVRVTK